MSDMPKEIWAIERGSDAPMHVAGDFENREYPNGTKYIRADLANQWRDIKTAPKDGTRITVFIPEFTNALSRGISHEAYWRNGAVPGWYKGSQMHYSHKITHWMPSPEPPEKEQACA